MYNRIVDTRGYERASLPPALGALLPHRLTDRLRKLSPSGPIEELRLRRGRYASLSAGGRQIPLDVILEEKEMEQTLLALCGGSLYAHAETIKQGYLTLAGGIRVGICGRAAVEDGRVVGVYEVSSLCFRFPHRPVVDARPLLPLIREEGGSLLLYAPPGVGKTTVLRGLIATLSRGEEALCVVDSRGELGCFLDDPALGVELLVGYPRAVGIEIAMRSLAPRLIVCDEIGSAADAAALDEAMIGGVRLLATAHAAGLTELLSRESMRALHRRRVFSHYVGLSRAPCARGALAPFRYEIARWSDADASL